MPSLARSPSILRAALMYQFSLHNCCMRLFLNGGPDSAGAGLRRDPAADGRRWGCGRGGKTSWPSTHTPWKSASRESCALTPWPNRYLTKKEKQDDLRLSDFICVAVVAGQFCGPRFSPAPRGSQPGRLPAYSSSTTAYWECHGVNSIAGLAGSIMADPARTGQTLAGSSGAALSRTDYQHSSAADILWPA